MNGTWSFLLKLALNSRELVNDSRAAPLDDEDWTNARLTVDATSLGGDTGVSARAWLRILGPGLEHLELLSDLAEVDDYRTHRKFGSEHSEMLVVERPTDRRWMLEERIRSIGEGWRYRLIPADRPTPEQWSKERCRERLGWLLDQLSVLQENPYISEINAALAILYGAPLDRHLATSYPELHVAASYRQTFAAAVRLASLKLSGMGGLDDVGALPVESGEIILIVTQALTAGTRA